MVAACVVAACVVAACVVAACVVAACVVAACVVAASVVRKVCFMVVVAAKTPFVGCIGVGFARMKLHDMNSCTSW